MVGPEVKDPGRTGLPPVIPPTFESILPHPAMQRAKRNMV